MITAHPLREALHNEVHARPYERMAAPLALTHIAVLPGPGDTTRAHLDALLHARLLPLPAADASHLSIELGGGLRLRWERHTEFHTFTFWRPLRDTPAAFEAAALNEVPQEWLQSLPGQWLVGLHVIVDGAPGGDTMQQLVRQSLDEESLVGANVMDDLGEVYTDFRLHADGYARLVLGTPGGVSPRRLGRTVQRLLEVETYRMAALLGLPAAREVGVALAQAENNLARIASEIRSADQQREPELLLQLTQLAGEVESLYARTHARFSASAAYFELLQRRIHELHEQRVHGLQTLGEFMDRRLAPAMQTCAWAARRQQALSERISRASNMLRTRVEIEQQQSSQELLDAMNRRQGAQLLLQSAVEGLSVAAITYYGAGLVGYIAKGLREAGLRVQVDATVAIAIPVIAIAVWLGIRRLHRKVLAVMH